MPLPTITDWDADTTFALLASMGQLLARSAPFPKFVIHLSTL
jgi:hypothetical protein